MKPTDRIKQIRRELIAKTNKDALERCIEEGMRLGIYSDDFLTYAKQHIEDRDEKSPEFWVKAIMDYLDEQHEQQH